jgi:hypothetical protein
MPRQLSLILAALLPLLVTLLLILTQRERQPPALAAADSAEPDGRLVVVIVDSLRQQALDAHMPHTQHPLHGPLIARPTTTCRANFSLPCIRTLLEGRESPFSAGIHNFTGQTGGAQSLPALAHQASLDVALISDITLESLYGAHARITHNLERWPGDRLAKDTRAIDEAIRALEDPAIDLVVLHVVGTDKVAHELRPGHPTYIRHFEGVDARLADLYARLDPKRDHLIVTGDHGHDDSGFHQTSSVALLQGPHFEAIDPAQIPDALRQTDLLGFMALALDLPLPASYEGRIFGIDPLPPDAPEAFTRFVARQRRVLAQAGFTGDALAAQLAQRDAARAAAPWLDAAQIAPWFIVYLWYILALVAVARGARFVDRASALIAPAVGALAAALLTALAPASPLPALLLTVALTIAALRHTRDHALVWPMIAGIALLALAGLTSAAGMSWSEFFHANPQKGQRPSHILTFYVGWAGSAALLTRLLWRRAAALPEGLALTAAIALPGGVYYYHFGQNILSGLIFGGILVALMRGRLLLAQLRAMSARERGLAALLLISSALILWQRGSAWVWVHGLWHALGAQHVATWPLIALVGAALVFAMPSRTSRAAMGATLVAAVLYAVGFAELPARDLLLALIPALFATAAASLSAARRGLRPELETSLADRRAVLLALSLCAAGWFLCRGYILEHVDFRFGLARFGHLKHERDVAFIVYLLTIPKYLLPLIPTVLAAWCLPHPERFISILLGVLILHIKAMALMIQVFAGPLGGEAKLHESAVMDLVFVAHFIVLLLAAASVELMLMRLRKQAQDVLTSAGGAQS